MSLLCGLKRQPGMADEAACRVGTLATLLDGCFLESVNASKTLDRAHCKRIFLDCLAWAFGGPLDANEWPAFDTEVCMLSQTAPHKASCSTHAVGFSCTAAAHNGHQACPRSA